MAGLFCKDDLPEPVNHFWQSINDKTIRNQKIFISFVIIQTVYPDYLEITDLIIYS